MTHMHPTRRRRLLKITPELLCSFLADISAGITQSDGVFVKAVQDGVPLTALGVRCGVNDRGDVLLLIEDESFSEIPEDCEIPFLDTQFSSQHPEPT